MQRALSDEGALDVCSGEEEKQHSFLRTPCESYVFGTMFRIIGYMATKEDGDRGTYKLAR
jgi:hypothetical protein